MTHHFRLYVAGITPNSIQAIENINRICREHLADQVELEVIDIYQQPELAKTLDLIAIPTLVRVAPLPEKHIVGNLSDTAKVLQILEIKAGK
ncbi:MAG: circadian clock KaiB family protein [Candidatus Cyclobacteriaceae bacterium M3_2C_046]